MSTDAAEVTVNASTGQGDPLVELSGLSKTFLTRAGLVRAVDDISFDIERGTTVGLVGESGSGKSTVARLLMALQRPSAGEVRFDGRDLGRLRGRELRAIRARMQMVFQNPYGSLLPHFTVGANIAEPLRLRGQDDRRGRRETAGRVLETVGLDAAMVDLYPRQFSGGQQQRIAVARALVLEPDLLVCDEPTSSLDVSVQAQILRLFEELHERMHLTMLFISHNLAVVEKLASRVVVMARGRIVEHGPTAAIFDDPRHPYTQTLLAAALPVRSDTSAYIAPLSARDWTPERLATVPSELREVTSGHLVRVETV
jgi:phosphonate C-P lyase system protein PhnK